MTSDIRILAYAAFIIGSVTLAFAGSGTITVKDGGGTNRTYDVVTDGSGNFVAESVICDYAAAANCATVDSSHSLHTTVDNATTPQSNASSGVATGSGNSPVISYLYGFSGSTWDQLQDDTNRNLKIAPQATSAGGALSSTWLASAASNNATNVKNAAGTLYSVTVTQSTTTAMELKLYNTSSSPTCSSATSLVDIIPIPSNATSPGYHLTYPVGRAFATGISFCLVAFGAPAAGTDNSNAVTGATVSMTYD